MRAVVATHGHCFDGLCSAVVFTRLLRALRGPAVRFFYQGCGYAPTQRSVEGMLDGDENAILDYRFSASDKVHWYFDHHRTAFGSDADRAFFEARREALPYHYDASYSSCTKLVRDVAEARYGVAMPELEPHGDGALLARLVPRLLEAPVEEVARRSEHRELYRKIRRKKAAFAKRVQQNARTSGRVVLVDLSGAELESYGKFVTYALYPNAMYSVILGRFKNGARINVGYNPWSEHRLDRDLSSICGRYGGGGHPFVGGISFPAEDVHRAKNVAQEIALELDG
jgi:hypothetical protein